MAGSERAPAAQTRVRIQVLDEAEDDLQDGRRFYDRQEPGVGDYFAAALAADIDSLILFAGIHPIEFGFHRAEARDGQDLQDEQDWDENHRKPCTGLPKSISIPLILSNCIPRFHIPSVEGILPPREASDRQDLQDEQDLG